MAGSRAGFGAAAARDADNEAYNGYPGGGMSAPK
jgi:hypothetical protein